MRFRFVLVCPEIGTDTPRGAGSGDEDGGAGGLQLLVLSY
jgi:hypothetical protein